MTWKVDNAPDAPLNIRTESFNNKYLLTWDHAGGANVRYAVYTSVEQLSAAEIIANQSNLMHVTFTDTVFFADINFSNGANFVITAISASGNESMPSAIYNPDINLPEVELVLPNNGFTVSKSDSLVWSSDASDAKYLVQISANSTFSSIAFESDWIADTTFIVSNANLDGEFNYFWRVRAKTDIEGPYSMVRAFTTGYPSLPELLEPANLNQYVSTHPLIKWRSTLGADNINVIISESSSFNDIVAQQVFLAEDGQGIIATELSKNAWYYIKINAQNAYGESSFTEFNTFKISAGELPNVSLMSPENDANVASFDNLSWQTTTIEGDVEFFIQVAIDNDFNGVLFESGWIKDTEALISALNIDGQRLYYWRAKAKSEFGESEFTDIRSFFAAYPSRPYITAPQNLISNVEVNPFISWNTDGVADSVYVEFSEKSDFSVIRTSQKFEASLGSGVLTASLKGDTDYFMQLRAENEFGNSVFSAKRTFETGVGNSIVEADVNNSSLVVFPNKISNGSFTVVISLKSKSIVTLEIYDILGNLVSNLFNGELNIGENKFSFNADKFPSKGLYFIKINNQTGMSAKPILKD